MAYGIYKNMTVYLSKVGLLVKLDLSCSSCSSTEGVESGLGRCYLRSSSWNKLNWKTKAR